MSKPKTTGFRKGGRNRQFFDSLTGLSVAIDRVVRENAAANNSEPVDKRAEAEAKRKRKAYARLKNAGLIK